ncbi:MAG: UvrD-helicase domain-containing protein [Planctomycetaceae bacterium]|jgi:DNA helicase-2/ATP-dependent DNA helicase PcrA|nr:UvrD-helicase domain-containing protein [Planctomycetaceae bacterium]
MESQSIIPEHLLVNLNLSQREAVLFKDGALLVLAGPGSGKTRVVTHRIASLWYQGVPTSQIIALTFTNKAAEEMNSRLRELLPNKFVWIGTFHKFCAKLIRHFADITPLGRNFTIYDTHESESVIKNIVSTSSLPPGINVSKIASAISWAKNNLINSEDYIPRTDSQLGMITSEIYPLYQKELRHANAADFDDLLLYVAQLLQGNKEVRNSLEERFRYILIDEYQDTNTVQYVIAKTLSYRNRNLAVTGDPDQSIYGWRGANIQNILDFEKDFPDAKIIRLELNYRSTPEVLAAADSVIVNNLYRKPKILLPNKSNGNPIRLIKCIDQNDEADSIAIEIAKEIKAGAWKPSDYAIFFRMNSLSRNLEHALRRNEVPFQLIRGLEFFNRKEVKDIIAYLRLIYNPADKVSFERVINEPVRGIGKTTLKKISQLAFDRNLTMLNAARELCNLALVNSRTLSAVSSFIRIIDKLSEAAARDYPVAALIDMVLNETAYRNQFNAEESEEDQTRLQNIDELLSEAYEFDQLQLNEDENGLEKFLEQASLASDADGLDRNAEAVSLMTLHAAKGLEFSVVYIIGIEEGILPHDRSQNDMQIEEERRLFFVGITRAKWELRLSHAARRGFRGSTMTTIASRFLMELPKNKMFDYHDSTYEIRNVEIIDPQENIKLIREQPEIKTINSKQNSKQITTNKQQDQDQDEIKIDYEDEYVDQEIDYL